MEALRERNEALGRRPRRGWRDIAAARTGGTGSKRQEKTRERQAKLGQNGSAGLQPCSRSANTIRRKELPSCRISTASSVCRPTFSSKSTGSRQRRGPKEPTSSISGMGNPDMAAPQHVIDKLVETVGKPRTDRYSASKGIAGLRRAQAAYYARRFGVKLDPGHPGRGDPRLQGRLRQHGAGHHRARRCGAGAQPELSDPCLRVPDGGRRHPFRAGGADARLSSRRRSGPSPIRSPSRSRWWSATPPTPRPMSRPSTSTAISSPSRRSTNSSCSPTSPMRRSISTIATRLPRCSRCRAPSM